MINIFDLKIISKKVASIFIVAIFLFSLVVNISAISAQQPTTQAQATQAQETCKLKDKLSGSEIASLVGAPDSSLGCDNNADGVLTCEPRGKGHPFPTINNDGSAANGGVLCVYSSFKNIVNIIKIGILVVSVIVFSIAGLLYATAGESDKRQSQAKSLLFSGVVGLIITGVAHIIPSLVTFVF